MSFLDLFKSGSIVLWKYECENGHKWESKNSPTSSRYAMMTGTTPTFCNVCGSLVCRAEKIIDGKSVGGAIHQDFGKNKESPVKVIRIKEPKKGQAILFQIDTEDPDVIRSFREKLIEAKRTGLVVTTLQGVKIQFIKNKIKVRGRKK